MFLFLTVKYKNEYHINIVSYKFVTYKEVLKFYDGCYISSVAVSIEQSLN